MCGGLLWDNGLYSVTCILNRRRLASSQAESRGGAMKTGEFWEEERVGLQSSPRQRGNQRKSKQDVTASPKKVPSHVANTDKNNGLI